MTTDDFEFDPEFEAMMHAHAEQAAARPEGEALTDGDIFTPSKGRGAGRCRRNGRFDLPRPCPSRGRRRKPALARACAQRRPHDERAERARAAAPPSVR